ncbi:hypothetical protein SDC9_118062 [bioreactor metagenome]|uniref:Uncharacterized protein n=1 Tax=bioreactor metagenome TaxID=1076179 RepID=A0A645C0E6_9ZZZZ|nr:hypothetical protein [Oscillospiraceae bacterium]
MNDGFMTHELCEAKRKNFEEKFGRDDKRIEKLERLCESIAETNNKIVSLVIELKHTNELICTHEKRLSELEDVPSSRWNGLVTSAVSAVAGGLIGYLMSSVL